METGSVGIENNFSVFIQPTLVKKGRLDEEYSVPISSLRVVVPKDPYSAA